MEILNALWSYLNRIFGSGEQSTQTSQPDAPTSPVSTSTIVESTPVKSSDEFWHRVKATREGLVGHKTATGWVIDTTTPFVALPSTKALHKTIRVRKAGSSVDTKATVLDVGPWNEHDDNYVFGTARPAAESGKTISGLGNSNAAGIDLGEAVWKELEMKDNGEVEWRFL